MIILNLILISLWLFLVVKFVKQLLTIIINFYVFYNSKLYVLNFFEYLPSTGNTDRTHKTKNTNKKSINRLIK